MTYETIIETDEEYCFDVTGLTGNNYKFSKKIVEWLQSNLTNLKDVNEQTIFSKVNYGYNENTIKGFGKKPVADVYLTNTTYDSDFQHNKPTSINSVIICYLKGNMNNTYLKACELQDYLLQEFEENKAWRELSTTIDDTYYRIVNDTFIRRTELRLIPGQKTYGVLCAFELEHQL